MTPAQRKKETTDLSTDMPKEVYKLLEGALERHQTLLVDANTDEATKTWARQRIETLENAIISFGKTKTPIELTMDSHPHADS